MFCALLGRLKDAFSHLWFSNLVPGDQVPQIPAEAFGKYAVYRVMGGVALFHFILAVIMCATRWPPAPHSPRPAATNTSADHALLSVVPGHCELMLTPVFIFTAALPFSCARRIRVTSSGDPRAKLNNGLWCIKIPLWIGFILINFFIVPSSFFVGSAGTLFKIGASLFLLLQCGAHRPAETSASLSACPQRVPSSSIRWDVPPHTQPTVCLRRQATS